MTATVMCHKTGRVGWGGVEWGGWSGGTLLSPNREIIVAVMVMTTIFIYSVVVITDTAIVL